MFFFICMYMLKLRFSTYFIEKKKEKQKQYEKYISYLVLKIKRKHMNKRTTHLKTSLFLPTHTHRSTYVSVCVCVEFVFLSDGTAHFLELVVVVADRVCVAFYQYSRSRHDNSNKF